MTATATYIKRISTLVQENIRDVELPEVEEPGLRIFYDPRRGVWKAQIGANYAGYFDAQAEIPIFLNKDFTTLQGLLFYLDRILSE